MQSLISRGIDAGLHTGAQVCVIHRDEVVVDQGYGELSADTLMPWLSCTKPTVAVAVAQQVEAGRLNIDDTVEMHLPQFAQHGKSNITIRHLLTHTAGLRPMPYRFPADNWNTIIEKICAMRPEPDWDVQSTAGYHASTTWFVLGELVQRASGQLLPDYMREKIFEPIGMNDCWVGMPAGVLEVYGSRIGTMMNTAMAPARAQLYRQIDRITACSPGGGGWGPMNQLAKFYQVILRGGEPLLHPDTAAHWLERHRVGMMDLTFQMVIDWGLGFIRDSKHHGPTVVPYGFGEHASEQTFGHGGYQSSLSFADPAHDLVVAFVFDGTPGERAHQQRSHDLATAIYEDLQLA